MQLKYLLATKNKENIQRLAQQPSKPRTQKQNPAVKFQPEIYKTRSWCRKFQISISDCLFI